MKKKHNGKYESRRYSTNLVDTIYLLDSILEYPTFFYEINFDHWTDSSHMSRMAMLLSSQYVFRKPYLAGRGQLKDIKT